MAMSAQKRPVYVEPITDYLARKHFTIGLALSPLLLLVTVDLLLYRELIWSAATYAFHGILLGITAVLLFVERHVWRFQRFKIFDDGFVLAGRRRLSDGGGFVRFGQLTSVKAVTTAKDRPRETLLYVALHLQPELDHGPQNCVPPEEIIIAREELRQRNIVHLWREFVKRGFIEADTLKWLESTI